ncbi:hypothetical protein Tco_0088821 [Tanacetum coccineum]
MKDKIEFRGRNELGNFTNVPVFIGNFYVITDFTVVEDMDPYLDEGIRKVVVGEPFCEVSYVETRRFDGIITIDNEDDNVTYQMVWSNLRFKHYTNEQCNKILPLLKKDRAAVRAEIEVLRKERLAYEQESMENRQALSRSKAYSRVLEARITVLETQARRYEWQRQDADDHVMRHIMHI